MLNHAARAPLAIFPLRESVLGRAVGRKTRDLQQASQVSEADAPISPVTYAHIRSYLEAWAKGDEASQHNALNKVMQAWRSDNAAGGVPVHGHMPLPSHFADTLGRLLRGRDEARVEQTIAAADASVRPLLEQQLTHVARYDRDADGDGWRLGNAPERPEPATTAHHLTRTGPISRAGLEDEARLGRPWRLTDFPPLLDASADTSPLIADQRSTQQAGVVPLAAKREPTEEDESDPLYDLAHPFAYGLDQALNDVFGKDGALGDWGKREVIPTPKGDLSRNAGELIRHYLQIGVPVGGVVKGARLARAIKVGLEKRSTKAILGGALSVIAEWRANGDKATGWDYGLSFVTGAITGGYEPKWGKAELDGALAFSSAVLGDILSGRRVDVGMALVGGAAAWLVTKAGGWVKFKDSGLWSQAAAKVAKKYFEKEAKEFFKAVFGDELVLTGEEWSKFLDALDEHMRRQYEEFIQEGDADPIF